VIFTIVTWTQARLSVMKQRNERGFVVAENVGYVVMGVVLIALVYGAFKTGVVGGMGDWFTKNVLRSGEEGNR
jgi:hypothetical protein